MRTCEVKEYSFTELNLRSGEVNKCIAVDINSYLGKNEDIFHLFTFGHRTRIKEIIEIIIIYFNLNKNKKYKICNDSDDTGISEETQIGELAGTELYFCEHYNSRTKNSIR